MEPSSLQPYLAADERLLWSGAPSRKYRFERKHLPIFFFIVPFFAFMLIPMIGIFSADTTEQNTNTASTQTSTDQGNSPKPHKKAPLVVRILFVLIFLCFFGGIDASVISGLGMQAGGHLLFRGEVAYGITNQRLIVVSGRKQKVVQSLHLGTTTDIRMKEWPDGLGTISFGPEPVWPYTWHQRSSALALENISESRSVFQMIVKARG